MEMGMIGNLIEIMNKHKDEKFLLPLSAAHKEEIP